MTDKKKSSSKKIKKTEKKQEKPETLREVIERLAPSEPFEAKDMIKKVQNEYPNRFKDASIRLHLMALDTTNPKAERNHPSIHKHAFLVFDSEANKYSRK